MVEPQWLVDNLYDLWNVGNDLVNIPVRETSQSCVTILCVNNYKFVIYISYVYTWPLACFGMCIIKMKFNASWKGCHNGLLLYYCFVVIIINIYIRVIVFHPASDLLNSSHLTTETCMLQQCTVFYKSRRKHDDEPNNEVLITPDNY